MKVCLPGGWIVRAFLDGYIGKLSIRSKLLVGYVTAFVVLSLIGISVLYPVLQRTIQDNIENELNNTTKTILTMIKASADASIKNYLRAIAEKNKEIVQGYYDRFQQGEMTEAEAKAEVIKILLSQHIGETGYIYCLNSQGVVKVHPVAQLVDVNVSDFAFVQTQIKNKDGYIEYDWKNPHEKEPRAKALYMTYFKEWDWIISASSYRQEFSNLVNVDSFRANILSIKFGETGYPYIFNSKGDVVVHPVLKGNYLDAKDFSGRLFVREMFEKKNGLIYYTWQNPGEESYRDKFAYFNYIPELDWIVVSSSYVDEFYHPLEQMRLVIIFVFSLTLSMIVLLTFLYSSYIVGHLDNLIRSFKLGSDGDYSTRIENSQGDEFGKLTYYFNDFMEKLESYHATLQLEIRDRRQAENELEKARDSLERKVAERTSELITAKDAAESANVAKSVFLANMSHELRTPMNAILGYSQLLQRGTDLKPEQREFLQTINRSGEHLLSLINNVLEISKIEAQHIEVRSGAFDLHALLTDVITMLKVRVVAKGLEFNVLGLDDLPNYVTTDEGKLRQILVNIIGNAIKFTNEGAVSIFCSSVLLAGGKVRLILEVQDTGPGIAENELEKAFQYLEQTETGRRSQSGTGLGLHISREYARMLGGDITVRSSLDKGSTFRVEILATLSEAKNIVPEVPDKKVIGLAPGTIPPRILVVDDKKENRQVLVRLLEVVGFNVREATNGKEALEIFEKWHPRVIFMDIRMPVMDGLDATRAIRKTDMGQGATIIAVTASVMREEQKPIYESGCNGLISKPFREYEIFGSLIEYLDIKYIYEDEMETALVSPPLTLTSEKVVETSNAIADLPSEIVERARQALLLADLEALLECCEDIASYDEALAEIIVSLAKSYQYEMLQTLLQHGHQDQEADHA